MSEARRAMSEQAKTTVKTATNPEEGWHMNPLVYAISWVVFMALYTFWCRVRLAGKENIPASGGLMAVSNHQSMLDPFIVAYAFQRPMRYMGKAELFKIKPVAWFLGLYGGFPVARDKRDPQALRTALNIMRARQVLGMFPEGTRTTTGEINEFRTGAIRLAIKAETPIIPCGIWGANRVLPPGARWPRPRPIGLAVGAPITFAHLYDHHPTPAEIAAAADELEAQIAALVKQAESLWKK
jgi:1-acyl-sn-glycerol-3-phosphate acyltransferase